MSATCLAVPFGMRFLTTPVAPSTTRLSGGYCDALQINITADGSPWHALRDSDTKTETTPDGNGPNTGSDPDGTDLW